MEAAKVSVIRGHDFAARATDPAFLSRANLELDLNKP
jgi:hypothetical protein